MVEWCIYCNPNDSASIYSDEQSMHVRLGPSGPGRSHVASSKKSFVYVCLYLALCAFMLRGVTYIHMYGCLYVGDYVENWVNHKMDAASAAIAKVVVVHVLQTCLCMYVCMYFSSLLHIPCMTL